MQIGIVSECTKERQHGLWWFGRNTIESFSDKAFEVVAVSLPYTIGKITEMSKKRRGRILKKAILKLSDIGIKKIVLSEMLCRYKNDITALCDGVDMPDGTDEFYKYIPDAVRRVAKKCDLRLLDSKVCISAKSTGRITEYLLEELCYDVRRVMLCTDDIEGAKLLGERFANETGFFPKIINMAQDTVKSADVVINIDEGWVRIGRNVVLNGVEFDFKLNGYSVNMLEIAACLPGTDLSGRVISYSNGKNKLTL